MPRGKSGSAVRERLDAMSTQELEAAVSLLRSLGTPRRIAIFFLWRRGASVKKIAEAVGSTPNSVQVSVHRMRKAGIDLPRRNNGFKDA